MRIVRAGSAALLLEMADLAEAQAWYAEILRRLADGDLPGVTDVVPAARTVLLDGVGDPSTVADQLRDWAAPPPHAASNGRLVQVPVHYRGPDLDDVARHWGLSPAGVVARHTSTDFTVAFCGFSPGFAYLSGLPAHLELPRRATPRLEVPAGSVGLAGPWCAVYPSTSPGGWQIIGHTDHPVVDLERDPPATLTPGTRVRFLDAGPTP